MSAKDMPANVIVLADRRLAQGQATASIRAAKEARFYSEYGSRLQNVRKALNIAEAEAAAVFCVTLKTYRRYEAGKHHRTKYKGIVAFAKKYKVKYLWLFEGRGPQFEPIKAVQS
jgi:hypothetical protein